MQKEQFKGAGCVWGSDAGSYNPDVGGLACYSSCEDD